MSSIFVTSSGILNWGSGNIDAAPLFFDTISDDFHLTWNSPCRDTGDSSVVTEPIDFEGDPRIALGTVDMGADEFYHHLYHVGDIVSGSPFEVMVVGIPTMPVLLGMGSGIQEPPLSTQYGNLYLQLPLAGQWPLGNVPGTGVLVFQATGPSSWNPSKQYPFQALVGPLGNPDSRLTNLMVLETRTGILHVPDDMPTIQTAIEFVDDGSVIIVRPGTYVENIDFSGKAITLKSEQGASVTIIDGNLDGSVVTFQSGEGACSILEGFTITNGDATRGGGIYCLSSSPTFADNIITMNAASNSGGGIYCEDSSPNTTNNILLGNTANYGGGIYCTIGSSPTITNSTITENAAIGNGGGIYGFNSSPVITNTILWNDSASNGSEFYFYSGSPAVTYCDVEGGWPGTGNIDAEPLFVTGPLGDHYLSQIASGQGQDSPCVDAGNPASSMIDGTTRTDEIQDIGIVDMGYHYPLP